MLDMSDPPVSVHEIAGAPGIAGVRSASRRHGGLRLRRGVGALAVLSGIATLVVGLGVAPPDAVQGQAMRLMYVHVPAAWSAFMAFGVVLVASVAYLWRRDLAWDRRARAAAEVGVGMTALTIALGSIWGRPIWGVWWTWDPRLLTTAVLLIIYAGYLGVHSLGTDAHLNARRSAVVGIVGFANVPIVHLSVVWWRSLHQPPTILRPGGPAAIDPMMGVALALGVIAFSAACTWVYLARLQMLGAEAGRTGTERLDTNEIDVVIAEVTVHAGRTQ